MNKTVKKIIIGSGITASALAAAGAVSYIITNKLVKVALDREDPLKMEKSIQKISGSAEKEESLELQTATEEKLKNSECETIEITARDGEKLVGHLHTCENAKRTIIAMHGWRSSWTKDFGLISDFWHNNDCNVLYVEQRGQGSSGGNYMGFGLLERYDCLDWINWAKEKYDDLPIYLFGVSMGASTVLMASGLELPENVHGIIADCGYTSPHAIWKHIVENNLHFHYNGIRGAIANDICKRKIRIGSKDYSCTDALKECKVPILFIHGTDDHFVPVEMTYENYQACASPKRLFIVHGAEHCLSYRVDKEGYEKAVENFWKDYDN